MKPAPGRALARGQIGIFILLAVSIMTACSSTAERDEASIPRDTTAATTADSGTQLTAAVEQFIENLYSPGARNLRALVVTVDGDVLVERYWNSSPATTHDTFSVTKSVTGTLAGIALADHSLRGLDQPLNELLPAYSQDMNPDVAGVTLHQLLTMSGGLPTDGPGGPGDWLYTENWVESIVDRGTVQPPGEGFGYSSVTSHLIAAAIDEATPGGLLDYARTNLFDPLGIDTRPAAQPPISDNPRDRRAYDRAAFAWPTDPQAHNTGHGFIKITARDMVKLGQLYLDGGRRDGRQLVSEDWVQQSTTRQVTTRGGPGDGYGYQWWTLSIGGHPAFAAVGYGGQLIEVVPALGLVVAGATAVVEGETPFDSTVLMELVRNVIVPHVEGLSRR